MASGKRIKSKIGETMLPLMQASEQSKKVEAKLKHPRARGPMIAYEIEHDLKSALWCGPAAISALTGVPTSKITTLIKRLRKEQAAVIGTDEFELEYVLNKLGFEMHLAYFYGGKGEKKGKVKEAFKNFKACPSFEKWLKTTKAEREKKRVGYIISMGPRKNVREAGHWAAVMGDHYICSQTEKWVHLDDAPNKKCPVDMVFAVIKR